MKHMILTYMDIENGYFKGVKKALTSGKLIFLRIAISNYGSAMIWISVVTSKHPLHALSILRARKVSFDLVVTDYHMPDMNGLELQRHVREEFNLPVISESKIFKLQSI